MSMWAALSWGFWLAIVILARVFRSVQYAIFRGITLGIHILVVLALLPHLGIFRPLYLALHCLLFIDSALLIVPRLRPTWYRWFISLPSQYMGAATFMAFPWAIWSAFSFYPWGFQIPYVLGLIGLVQSLSARSESRSIVVGDVEPVNQLSRHRYDVEAIPKAAQPLKIAQITDPHLGPFMPVARLKRICERIVQSDPDLVLLTGDFLTMESQHDERFLSEGLSPLAALQGRVFACMGNHDHEAPKTVFSAMKQISATMLIDEATLVETRAGLVQILGLDFHFKQRRERIASACARHPRISNALRLVLLHDPGAFAHLPKGEADLVLSGHTHGGQVGLLSLGSSFTLAGFIAKIPDHGLWAHGQNRLYVHRGTGHYGFPLRLGVPAEESIVSVYKLSRS